MIELKGRKIYKGFAKGKALVSSEPISFYGGVDPETGIVKEENHPLEGKKITDKILVFPKGKGSTVGSYILYWMASIGTAPAAIINQETETIVAVGAIIGEIPCVDKIDISKIKNGDILEVDASNGAVRIYNE